MKSNASDHLIEMVQAIYKDACAKCIADVSDLRDLETIRSRVEKEGLSFLTITLPEFCNDFQSSLQSGQIDPTSFRSFRKFGSIPAFLRGMIGRLFNQETGRIYDEKLHKEFSSEAPVIVEGIRQICLTFKKMELVCTPKRVSKTLENFIALEHDFQSFFVPESDRLEFLGVSDVLWGNMLGDLRLDMLVPRHGPGATAEGISGNQKYLWRNWHERLEPFFPIIDSCYSCSAIDSEELEIVKLINQDQEQPVKVTPVPKTMKGPRIIAIEPVCMQYAQQAIQKALYALIESSGQTRGRINFASQEVNQKLALISSKTGQFATIDLSDASDRVPRDLALEMFRSNPDLLEAIDACRSRSAKMPNGEIISPLGKFASMGSALCFPVESMYFYTICVAALLKSRNLPVSYRNCLSVRDSIYVYGDDIIVPSAEAITVVDYLQKYNCKVNSNKTFVTGKFRESCGVDAYDGELVTPVYLRRKRPDNRQQVRELISWVATANLFYKKGYWNTARLMFCTCESVLGPLPNVPETSSVLGRISFLGYRSFERWNGLLHRFELNGWKPRPVYRSDRIDGYPALQKSLLQLTLRYPDQEEIPFMDFEDKFGSLYLGDPSFQKDHLERTALYGAVALHRHWVPA